jgi:membrane-associated protein
MNTRFANFTAASSVSWRDCFYRNIFATMRRACTLLLLVSRSFHLDRGPLLDTLLSFLSLILHIDKSLGFFIQHYGGWVYAVLFLIVFCETGLVVLPFLPGDSLLFIGGPKVFDTHIPVLERFLDREALRKTQGFYERHGGKTIVLARFVPIVRTFAPFVAGASAMKASRFQLFNILGALIWVLLLVLLGYFFGNIPFIRQYLNVIALIGVCAAIVPIALGALWKVMRRKAGN